MSSILHRLTIDAAPEHAQKLLARKEGIERWWTGHPVDGDDRAADRSPSPSKASAPTRTERSAAGAEHDVPAALCEPPASHSVVVRPTPVRSSQTQSTETEMSMDTAATGNRPRSHISETGSTRFVACHVLKATRRRGHPDGAFMEQSGRKQPRTPATAEATTTAQLLANGRLRLHPLAP